MQDSWSSIRFDYTGAKVLITGGTSGIGRGIAEAYRAAGADVTITGTRGSPADYDDDFGGMRYLRYDTEDDADLAAVAAALPALDALVNSAGVALFTQGLDENDPVVFDRSLRVHLSSAHHLAERCAPALARSRRPGGGSITFIASMSSYFAHHLSPAYGVAKTGLLGLTRQLAVRWAQHGVRVNALASGLVRSRMSADFFADPNLAEPFLARVPLGRHGEPHDIAGAALFLASDAAAWITGQTFAIDGGFSIKG